MWKQISSCLACLIRSCFICSVARLSTVAPTVKPARAGPFSPRYTLTWDKYHSHDVINEFIDELAATNDWVNTVSIGKTTEGRDLRVIQIAKAGPGKPNVFIDAGNRISRAELCQTPSPLTI